MANSIFRNKNKVRPKKKGHARNQRNKQHIARLVGMGMDPEQARILTPKDRRLLLRHPQQTAAVLADINAEIEACTCGCEE